MPRGWLMPCLPICTLVPAKALLTDSRVASATPTKRVQERVSKDFSFECRALPGRIGLMVIFGSSLLLFFSAGSLPTCLLDALQGCQSARVCGLPDRGPTAAG